MEITVLGPLRVGDERRNAAPTAGKPRKVLALLLLNHGRPVPLSALVDELWPNVRPRTALATLHTYVLQLRKGLAQVGGLSQADVAADLLRTATSGYEFHTGGAFFDLAEYGSRSESALRAVHDGDLVTAVAELRAALALWRGPALADVEPGRLLAAEIAGLEQSRMTMLEHRIDFDLRLGRHREVLGELTALVATHPLHEDLHAQLMLALFRSGYRTRALEVYQQLRGRMVESVGLEPSPRLRQVHQLVLSADDDVDRISVVPLPRRPEAASVPLLAGLF
ncbi:MAG TPA: BTAD domain-containing putative transcriptional regulator [Pseudonocardiaceae bacterium]|jgi:DNA-binding SARP family transcriptional activator|nr:BTAD domain-containing putative transcriptional regulator [Pseudonocardiaceae bacterium]